MRPGPKPGGILTSAYYGVSWHKSSSRWAVQIRHEGKRIHVGYYASEKEAALSYDQVGGGMGGGGAAARRGAARRTEQA